MPETAMPKTAAPGRPVRASVALAFALAAAWVGASVPRSPDPALTLSYGQDPRQIVVVYTAPRAAAAPAGAVSSDAMTAGAARPPLAVYVHGGAWRAGSPMRVRAKPQWFREAGWGSHRWVTGCCLMRPSKSRRAMSRRGCARCAPMRSGSASTPTGYC